MTTNPYLRPLGIFLSANELTAEQREEFRKEWYAIHIGPREPAKIITAENITRVWKVLK
jgi:hypothetical protein